MQDILIYGGIGINIVGAIFLMAYAFKYGYAFRQARKQQMRMDELKSAWAKKRAIGFGLMIGGCIVAIIGCLM